MVSGLCIMVVLFASALICYLKGARIEICRSAVRPPRKTSTQMSKRKWNSKVALIPQAESDAAAEGGPHGDALHIDLNDEVAHVARPQRLQLGSKSAKMSKVEMRDDADEHEVHEGNLQVQSEGCAKDAALAASLKQLDACMCRLSHSFD